jgi:hypothetical protein
MSVLHDRAKQLYLENIIPAYDEQLDDTDLVKFARYAIEEALKVARETKPGNPPAEVRTVHDFIHWWCMMVEANIRRTLLEDAA